MNQPPSKTPVSLIEVMMRNKQAHDAGEKPKLPAKREHQPTPPKKAWMVIDAGEEDTQQKVQS